MVVLFSYEQNKLHLFTFKEDRDENGQEVVTMMDKMLSTDSQ